MDQKLLEALSNMSEALEQIAEALKEKGGGANNSATTQALQGGDFVKQIKEINVGVKQLQIDSKKILKNQETIIALSRKSAGDKKSPFEEAGGDKKKESQIKKGIGTILLIAVAVLAIGMAFKLVGKIDFLSVVGLGLAMLIMSEAFRKIAELKIDLKQAAIASATMVMMAIAVTLSSWVLKLMTPIGIAQLFTGIAITTMFYVMTPKFAQLLEVVSQKLVKIGYADIVKATVILVAMAVAITLSSWVLRLITPLSFGQIITGIGITAMFYVVANFLPKLALSIVAVSKIMSKKDLALMPLMLVSFALAITLSSWILRFVVPMSFGQIITGIAITAMFWVVANFLPRLALSIILVSKIMSKKDLALMPILMVAFALAITLSSWILKMVIPLSFGQIITTILITAVFWAVSKFLPDIALGVIMVDKILGKNKIWMIPLVFIAISAAMMISAFLFSQTPELGWKQMVGILLIGLIFAGLSYIMPEMAAGLVLMDRALGKGKMFLIPLVYVAIAVAIMLSSHILSVSAEIPWMKLLNILIFSAVLVIATVLIGLVSIFLVKVVGMGNVMKGAIAIVVIAAAIMLSSWFINKGKYNKYPSWRWSLFSVIAIAAFGAVAWLLTKIGGISTYIKGAIAILAVAATIMLSSHVLSKGNYSKYPKLSWALGVAASLAAFGIAAALLGPLVFGPQAFIFLAGCAAILGVAETIVLASHILATGNYARFPSLAWAGGVALSLAAFTTGMVLLGGIIVASFGLGALALEAGSEAVLGVAQTIVDSSHILAKGNWKKGPTKEWSSGVAMALGAFAPVFKALSEDAGWSMSGDEVLNNMVNGVLRISGAIVGVGRLFEKSKLKWTSTPTKIWSWNVSQAVKSYAKLAKDVSKGGFFTNFLLPLQIVSAMVVIGKLIQKNKVPLNSYPNPAFVPILGISVRGYVALTEFVTKSFAMTLNGGAVERVAIRMATTARILEKNKKYFAYSIPKSYIINLAHNLLGYAIMARELEKLMTITEKKFIPLSILGGKDIHYTTTKSADISIVNRVAAQMSMTAAIIGKNARFFNTKIDPNFMKSVASNLFYYMAVAKRLNQEQKGGLMGMIKNALTTDPVIQMAKGMIELAKAYDRLSISITKMGAAAATLNDKKIMHLERLSRIRLPDWYWRGIDERKGLISTVTSAIGNLFTPSSSPTPAVAEPSKRTAASQSKGKHGTVLMQNDKIIDLLMALNEKIGQGSNLDAATIKYLTAKAGARMGT